MKAISLLELAHNIVREKLQPGEIAIDATVGNGHDTLFLVEQVSPSGRVYGFDIQQTALDVTWNRFQQTKLPTECLTLIHESHALMDQNIPASFLGKINVIMFNLGYLPGGDKTIITQTDSTLTALTVASRILSAQGIITILTYPGHQCGDEETDQVKRWCEQLDAGKFKVNVFYCSVRKDSAPRFFVIEKILL